MARAKATARSSRTRGVSFDQLRSLALALPGTEEGTSYGTPAFRVRKKLFARLRDDEDSLVLLLGPGEREDLIDADPKTFYITDHYASGSAVLVRLSRVRAAMLRDLLEHCWRRGASKRQITELESTRNGSAQRV